MQPDSQKKVLRHPDQRQLQTCILTWRRARRILKPPQETRLQDSQSRIFLRKDKERPESANYPKTESLQNSYLGSRDAEKKILEISRVLARLKEIG